MKSKVLLFLVFLIVFVVLTVNLAETNPDVESLYVDGFNSVNEEWTEVGASPWLSDSDTNEIYTKTDEYWHEDFTFVDPSGSDTINSVTLYMEIKGSSARNDYVVIDLFDGSAWTNVANQDPDVDDYTWFNYDVSAILDAWTKITNAKLRVQYQRSGSPSTVEIYVRRAYLYVDWSVGGQNYVADLSQSISSTWNILSETNYNILPSKSLTTSWDILTEWSAIANLTQTISSSWEILLSHGMFVDLSQGVSSVWETLISHGMFVDLSQSAASTWNVLTQTDYEIAPSQSFTTSWNVLTGWDALLEFSQSLSTSCDVLMGWDVITDLTQTVATSWEVLTGWDAVADFSQSVSMSWDLLLKSTFNVITSLSNTFSWLVDAVKTAGGINYFADLSQTISTTWDIMLEWNAFVDLSETLSTTWTVTIRATFNVVNSMAQSFSWTVDILTGTTPTSGGTTGGKRVPPSVPPTTLMGEGYATHYVTIEGFLNNYVTVKITAYVENPFEYPLNATVYIMIKDSANKTYVIHNASFMILPNAREKYEKTLDFHIDFSAQEQKQDYWLHLSVESLNELGELVRLVDLVRPLTISSVYGLMRSIFGSAIFAVIVICLILLAWKIYENEKERKFSGQKVK